MYLNDIQIFIVLYYNVICTKEFYTYKHGNMKSIKNIQKLNNRLNLMERSKLCVFFLETITLICFTQSLISFSFSTLNTLLTAFNFIKKSTEVKT